MSFFPILTLQHPFATSWPSSPKGDARESSTILPELTPLPSTHSAPALAGGKVVAPATKGGPPEGCRKSMTQRFLAAHPRCPLRGHRVYGAKRRCDTPLLSGPPIGGTRPAPTFIYHYPTAFPPTGIYRLSFTCHSYRDPSLRMTRGRRVAVPRKKDLRRGPKWQTNYCYYFNQSDFFISPVRLFRLQCRGGSFRRGRGCGSWLLW